MGYIVHNISEGAAGNSDSLGRAGGSGSKDYIGQIVCLGNIRNAGMVFFSDCSLLRIEEQELRRSFRKMTLLSLSVTVTRTAA